MLTDYFSKIDLAWLRPTESGESGSPRMRAFVPIVSQVRIHRNIAGFPFPNKCDDSMLYDIAAMVLSATGRADCWSGCDSRMMDHLDELSKNLLLEKRLISRAFMKGGPGRFIVRDYDGTVACMINEADHISVAVSMGGLDLRETRRYASLLIDSLALEYAEDPILGCLTSDLGLVGTGLKASVLLHIPALDYTGAIKRAVMALEKDYPKVALHKLAYGKGESVGALYLAANKVTLAVSPGEIIDMLQGACEMLIDRETSARRDMRVKRDDEIVDKFWRAWGTLRHARRLSLEEAISSLSFVKLGSELGYLPNLRDDEWKRLFIASQPFHLNAGAQSIIDRSEELSLRAALYRQFIENRSII